MIFIQCILVGIGLFVLLISVLEHKAHGGIIEWISVLLMIMTLVDWAIKY